MEGGFEGQAGGELDDDAVSALPEGLGRVARAVLSEAVFGTGQIRVRPVAQRVALDVGVVVGGGGLAECEEKIGDGCGPAEEAVELTGWKDGDGGRVGDS